MPFRGVGEVMEGSGPLRCPDFLAHKWGPCWGGDSKGRIRADLLGVYPRSPEAAWVCLIYCTLTCPKELPRSFSKC